MKAEVTAINISRLRVSPVSSTVSRLQLVVL